MNYDVLILGGGIIGCNLAYELSKYNLNIAVIEKDYDVADDISFVNTAIVYDGSETNNEKMSKLEYAGNKLIQEACDKFGVALKKVGALRIADEGNAIEKLERLYKKAKEMNIEGVYYIDDDDAYDIEPNLNVKFKKALYSENVFVVAPYDLALAYAEVAFDNGVSFRLEEEVIKIQSSTKGFNVTTNKNRFTCRIVINTIPNEIYLEDNEVKSNEKVVYQKNMQYLLVDDNSKNILTKVVTNVLDEETFVVNIPTLSGGALIGVRNAEKLTLHQGVELANLVVPNLVQKEISNIFKEEYDKDEVVIDDSEVATGYISITGKHYGKITMAPAICKEVSEYLAQNLNITCKKDFVDKRREFYRFRELSKRELNEIIKLDKRYGKVVCVCNKVSEGEIIDCIRRPLGARTVEGVKRRTGAAFGNCNGSYCTTKIINILAREMDKKLTEIVVDSKNSRILTTRIKEFKDV